MHHFLGLSFFVFKLLLCFQTDGEQMPSEAYFIHHHIMKKIQHPNVIKLYQYLSVDDFSIYIFMERPASCQDLQRVLQKRRLTEKEARRYFKQIIEATICCEENGVVHRDLKPENILLDKESDEIKIIDFGLASRVQYEPYNKFRGESSLSKRTTVKLESLLTYFCKLMLDAASCGLFFRLSLSIPSLPSTSLGAETPVVRAFFSLFLLAAYKVLSSRIL